jgi:hypothetical protein
MVRWLATKAALSVSSKFMMPLITSLKQIKEGWRWLHAVHTGMSKPILTGRNLMK